MKDRADYSPELEAFLRESFRYDPETGDVYQLINRYSPRGQLLSPAGKRNTPLNHSGYPLVTVKFGARNHLIKVHRLAFFLTEGNWPNVVDHINHNRADNRWCNLRNVDESINGINRAFSYGKNAHLPVGIYEVMKNGYRCYKVNVQFRGNSANTYRAKLEDAIEWRQSKLKELGAVA